MKTLLLAAALLVGTSATGAAGAAGASGATGATSDRPAVAGDRIEVWVDLVEAAATTGPERRQRRQAEQDRVAARVYQLGGQVTVRLRHARHAMLVQIAPDKVADLRRIPGVLRVRPARTLRSPELMPLPAP